MEDFGNCSFHYDEEKERWLRLTRGLSFEEVVERMRSGEVVNTYPDPSLSYPHKKIALVEIGGYMTATPYVREGDDVFLKTIFRSRKANKKYGRRQADDQKEKKITLH